MSNPNLFYLVAIEAAHIQDYIFNSNRLRENIGASYLVAAVTDTWAREEFAKIEKSISNEKRIEFNTQQKAEVLYAGGGNFVGIFRTDRDVKAFTKALTQRVLFEAPGLHIIAHSISYEWADHKDNPSLASAIKQLLSELKKQRNQQPANIGLSGLGVTAMCDSTSLPAVTMIEDQDKVARIYSAESVAKRAFASDANGMLAKFIDLDNRFCYPFDFDDLGRTEGEKSYIAVVHADGNGIGKLVTTISNHYNTIAQNRAYIEALHTLSDKIKSASNAALKAVVDTLQSQIKDGIFTGLHDQADLTLKKDGNHFIFPFRPLVFGGDDVTFVCDGRIGIALAVEFVRQFELETKNLQIADNLPIKNLTMCAGIAITKVHYPFARAYDLAEKLCQSAKALVRDPKGEMPTHSAIDWHFTAGGLYGTLEAIRAREYKVSMPKTSLTLRPVFIDGTAHAYRTWQHIERVTTAFQWGDWRDSRNKAKALTTILRQGQDAVKAYKTRYLEGTKLSLPSSPYFEEDGWHELEEADSKTFFCGYFDALELMDLHIPFSSSLSLAEEAHG